MSQDPRQTANENGGFGMSFVSIRGVDYRLEQPVVDEITRLRRAATDAILHRIQLLAPRDNDDILVTFPRNTSVEFVNQLITRLSGKFPGKEVILIQDSLGLHTQEGFAALTRLGNAMAEELMSENFDEAREHAKRWQTRTNGR